MDEIKIVQNASIELYQESYGGRFLELLLHVRRDEISSVHLRSNGYDLTVMIHIQAFHQSHLLKMKQKIRRLLPNLSIYMNVLGFKNVFLDVF